MKMVLETESRHTYRNIDSNQCPGCPSNLATKLVMNVVFQACGARGEKPIVFGQGCGIGRNFLQRSGIGTHDSACVALKAAMAARGIERPVVVIDGDGQLDMGFEDFAGCFQQGYPYVHIVCDNQSYAASGTHATGTTDMLARTSTRSTGRVGRPDGRIATRKQPAMMIMFSGARYSATASPLHFRDLERKILHALDNMPAFIQILAPCNLSWGYDDEQAGRVTRLAVDCGIWPLWEWKDGLFRRSAAFQTERAQPALKQYLAIQRRYAHLQEPDIQAMWDYVLELNRLVDRMEVAFNED